MVDSAHRAQTGECPVKPTSGGGGALRPTKRRFNWSLLLSVIGMVLAAYAVHVEIEHERVERCKDEKQQDSAECEEYKSLCDFSPEVSCQKVFSSEYGKIWSYLGIIPKGSVLDQPNAVYGFVFYVTIALISVFMKKNPVAAHVALFFGAFSVCLSVYLGYILAFVLQHFCALCVSTYVLNFGIFFDSWSRLSILRTELKEKKSAKAL